MDVCPINTNHMWYQTFKANLIPEIAAVLGQGHKHDKILCNETEKSSVVIMIKL